VSPTALTDAGEAALTILISAIGFTVQSGLVDKHDGGGVEFVGTKKFTAEWSPVSGLSTFTV
jgi:hypothetical protein